MRLTTARYALLALDAFAAASALTGGFLLVAGLEASRFPREMLKSTPFNDFVIPGLLLGLVVGGSALVAAIAIMRNTAVGAVASVVAGVVMMVWIAGELLLLSEPSARSWTEAMYFLVGLAMVGFGLMLELSKRGSWWERTGPRSART